MSELREYYDERFDFIEKPEVMEILNEERSLIKIEKPVISIIILVIIMLGCIFANIIINHDPTYMDLSNCNVAPNGEFFFGTDSMGRDIFSMIWYGGRISLIIGILATIISTSIAIIYGGISGLAPKWIDEIMMRFTEILLSIPSILTVVFLQGILGKKNIISISIVIGITSWMSISKIIRGEVIQLKNKEFVIVAKSIGARKLHIIRKHLVPNFIPTIMFMIVMNIRGAIVLEATLSFLGIGLPLEVISWGSMLSLSEKALLTNSWWIIFIPGIFLVVTIMCIANIGKYIERKNNTKESYL